MANYKLEYSQIVRRKLKSLRAYLKAEYGEEVSKKSIKKITDAARGLQKLPDKGVELSSIFDIDTDYNLAMSLLNSKFRTSFKLKQKDIDYIQEKGLDTIRAHAADFIAKREAPAVIPNDGKQTPTKGHPVFIAQHATATCCRECIRKWHKMYSLARN